MMELTEYIAEYLRANDYPSATSGQMPEMPDRIATVYATGVRARQDGEGSRFQIICRSEKDADTALADILRVIELLDDFTGITTPTSPYFTRIICETGAANLGVDANNRLLYSANFRCWYC